MRKDQGFRFIGNPFNLLILVFRYGLHLKYLGRFLIYFIKSLLLSPFYLFESIFFGRSYSKTVFDQPPVFILGHHRSGTTLLHKLLSADPRFGYFKNSNILFPRIHIPGKNWIKRSIMFIIRMLKIKTFAYNNVLFELDDPQEEDMCMTGMFEPGTFYWKFVFPASGYDPLSQIASGKMGKRWKEMYSFHLKRIQYHNKTKRLLLKNPPNTARIKTLLELFPDAQFVYINRDPYEVIYSSLRLWKKGLQAFSMQRYDDNLVEDHVFYYYKSFYDKYHSEKNLIPAENLIETHYDELQADPLSVIMEIYKKFDWDFAGIKDQVLNKINVEKNYKGFNYQRNGRLDKRIQLLGRELAAPAAVIN